MKLIMLNNFKNSDGDEDYTVEFTTKNHPMIISCKMKYRPELFVNNKEYDADVRFYSFCWWSDRLDSDMNCYINNLLSSCNFISSTIEEVLEINTDADTSYIKYKTTLFNQVLEMVLLLPKQNRPIKNDFKVGDTIVGIFKAEVSIK